MERKLTACHSGKGTWCSAG